MARGKRLSDLAKKKVHTAYARRHTEPALAAQNLRTVLGHVGQAGVWKEVALIDPNAVDELKAVLRKHPAGTRV